MSELKGMFMLPDRIELERRRNLLMGAMLYVEEQCRDLSRDSADFLEWVRHEMIFVEVLLRHYETSDDPIVWPMAAKVAA